MPWVRLFVCSITLLSNGFSVTPYFYIARFLKICDFARICLWLYSLTKFGLGKWVIFLHKPVLDNYGWRYLMLSKRFKWTELVVSYYSFVSQTLSYCVFLFFPLRMHCCPLGFICSDCFYWNPHVHCILVIGLLVNFWCLSPLRPRIISFARFPYFLPLFYSLTLFWY